jgi:uncharacterized RDD family membrane protein YckC
VLPAGSALAHYVVGEVLGAGGMGTVYLAHDTALDRPVALKVLRPEVAEDPTLAERFVREARAAARVSHPNLTHVYFVGSERGLSYFAMEYCPGATLEATVTGEGPLPLERGLDVLVQAARGLAAAHGAGVVHRDVKPSNIMLLPDGRVKITDFGLAKSLRGDAAATGGRILGTPSYMSPEQVRGREVDARTDVYLLGLTAWFLFAGRPPFEAEQIGELIHDQLDAPLPPLRTLRGDLPPGLDGVLARMCAKDPAARPPTMEEVARLLEGLRPQPLIPAPLAVRGAAVAVDLMILVVAGLALAGFDKALTGDAVPDELYGPFVLVFSVLLLVAAEMQWGASAGKRLMNLSVVRMDGARPSTKAVLVRYALRFPLALDVYLMNDPEGVVMWVFLGLQAMVIAAGMLCYLLAGRRTLSDLLTGTRVVYRLPAAGVRAP